MLLSEKSSCFVDAIDLAFGAPANEIAAAYKELLPDSDPASHGYHSSVVCAIIIERYGTAPTPIDVVPADAATGKPIASGSLVEAIRPWFGRPLFRCVADGIRPSDGEPHSVAWIGNGWVDPSQPNTVKAEPGINIQTIWVLALAEREEPDSDSAEHNG